MNLNHNAIAYKIYERQRKMKSGFVKECLDYLNIRNIKESVVCEYNQIQWKWLLRKALKEKNRNNLLEKMKQYKKFDYFEKKEETFEM